LVFAVNPSEPSQGRVLHTRAHDVADPEAVDPDIDERRQKKTEIATGGCQDTERNIVAVQQLDNPSIDGESELSEDLGRDQWTVVRCNGFIEGRVVDGDLGSLSRSGACS